MSKKTLSLLSLFMIIGIVLTGLSYNYPFLIYIGAPLAFIGGIAFGLLLGKKF